MSETTKQERVCSCWLGSAGETFGSSVERQACAVHGDGAPASSGPAALVERAAAIRAKWEAVKAAALDGDLDVLNPAHHAAWSDIKWLLDALASASPAPACASCAAKDEHIEAARVAIAQAQEWAEKWKALAFREQALQQSQAQEIQRLLDLLDKREGWQGE